ncbi:autotransporter domain-containing protein, partial [Rickettsiaceae bacterium]|nr:autotransporter domain-containing protein [Rickettsiaceae bacterium]
MMNTSKKSIFRIILTVAILYSLTSQAIQLDVDLNAGGSNNNSEAYKQAIKALSRKNLTKEQRQDIRRVVDAMKEGEVGKQEESSFWSFVKEDSQTSSVSAGSENHNNFRAWINGSIRSSKSKGDSDSRHNILSRSFVIGIDKLLENENILGMFYHHINGSLKPYSYHDSSNEDNGFGIRGTFNLSDQVGLVAAGSIYQSKIKGDNLPSVRDVNSMSAYSAINYIIKMSDLTFKPKLGVEFLNVETKSYNTNDTLKVQGFDVSFWDIYTGFSLRSKLESDEYSVHFKLFGDIYHNIYNRKSNIKITSGVANSVSLFNEPIKSNLNTRWSL